MDGESNEFACDEEGEVAGVAGIISKEEVRS